MLGKMQYNRNIAPVTGQFLSPYVCQKYIYVLSKFTKSIIRLLNVLWCVEYIHLYAFLLIYWYWSH